MKSKLFTADKIFTFASYALLITLLIVVLYPIYFITIASFSSPAAVGSGKVVLWPVDITFEGYTYVLKDMRVWKGLLNSVYIVIFGTLFNLFLTLPAAYAMTIKHFMFRGVFAKLLLFTMYFSGGLIPTYLLVSDLGLYNKPYTLILLGGVSVTNIIIARTTIANSIPYEMYEAVTIDGGDHFTYFTRFVLPLSKSIIAVLMLYYGVGHWNSWYNAFIYLNEPDYYPLQLVLRNILIAGQQIITDAEDAQAMIEAQRRSELMKYSLIIITSVPMFMIYPFIQKYFEKGVMIGSVKG